MTEAAEWPRCCEIFWNKMTWPRSSRVALPLLTPAIWYCGQRTGQVLCATVYVFVCFWHSVWSSVVAPASRDTKTAGWHRNVTKTKRLKPPRAILLFVQCQSSASSLSVPESYAPQRWTITKPTINPRPCEKNRRCAKLTRVKRDIFWLTIKALLSTRSHKMCKHRRVDWFRICTLELIFCNGCCGCEALVHLVVGVFYVWTSTFLINCCFFYGFSCWPSRIHSRLTVFPINDSQRHINCVASIKIKSTLSSLHTCLWLTYLLEWHLIQRLLSNFFSQGALIICFLYQLLNKGWVSS